MGYFSRQLVSLFLSFSLVFSVSLPSHAIGIDSFKGLDSLTGPSEFLVQDYQSQKLITVHLLSGVSKPGLYRIPQKTNLITLLSYSGGVSQDADSEKVVLKNKGSTELRELSLKDLMVQGHGPTLQDQDIIFVDKNTPIVGQDTLLLVGLTSSILSIVLFSFLIANQNKK